MLRSAQVRAEFAEEIVVRARFVGRVEFAEKTVLCEISLVDARARAKPCYASALHAWVGQVRAGFAEKTVLRARLLSYSSSAAIFPRKPRLVSELNAWVPRRSAPGLPRKPCSALCSSPIQR